ncbi:unnamed protein product, partial [Prorocentrum cordatum]
HEARLELHEARLELHEARLELHEARLELHEREDKEEMIWIRKPPLGFSQGRAFVDGSATDPEDEVLRRAGWSIVVHSEAGQVLGAVRGTVPFAWAPLQLARDGGDYTFHFLSGCAQAPLGVPGDCTGSTRCAASVGKALDKGAARKHLWTRWWLGLVGDEQVLVTKAQAHRPKSECVMEAGRQTRECHEEKEPDAASIPSALMVDLGGWPAEFL